MGAVMAVNVPLLCIIIAVCCCSLSTGWLIGIWGGITSMPSFLAVIFPKHSSSSPMPQASNADTYCMYNDQSMSFSGSVIYLAALPALAAAAYITHKFGRKPTMWAIVVLLSTGAAIGAAANNLAAVFVSRAVLGMAMGCSFQAPTMLLCEVLPRQSRGLGMYCYNIALSFGCLLAGLANMLLREPAWGWRASIALLGAPAVILGALLLIIPESPQLLLQHGKREMAAKVLQQLRPPGSNVATELNQMRAAAARATSIGSTPQRLVVLFKSYTPELLACSLWPLVLVLTGFNVLSTWTPNLLLALGADPEYALRSNTIMMAVGLAAALLGTLVIERMGRRTLLAVGGGLIAASMAALGVLLATVPVAAPQLAQAVLLPVALVLLCIIRAALTSTLQPLAATVPAEFAPLEVRSDISSLTTGIRNSSSLLITQFALPLLCSIRWGLFLMFAVCTAAGSLLLWLLVPETRGLPIEEVHLSWSSHWLRAHSKTIEQRASCIALGESINKTTADDDEPGSGLEVAEIGVAAPPAVAVATSSTPAVRGCKVHVDVAPQTAPGSFGGKLAL